MANARKMLNSMSRFQEGGEVEMPEEQASPFTEAAELLAQYKQTGAPATQTQSVTPPLVMDGAALTRAAESSNNYNVGFNRAGTSDAFGAYQILSSTYKGIQAADPFFLDKKQTSLTPAEQDRANQVLRNMNSKGLMARNVAVTEANLQLAHFLGPKGAALFLKDRYISPAAAAANGGLKKAQKIADQRLAMGRSIQEQTTTKPASQQVQEPVNVLPQSPLMSQTTSPAILFSDQKSERVASNSNNELARSMAAFQMATQAKKPAKPKKPIKPIKPQQLSKSKKPKAKDMLQRFAEGGEVTDEFPEEAGAMPDQNMSEAAKQMLFYKKTAAPTPPTDIARLGKQAGLIGLGFAPGAGVADYFGKFPAVEGGTEPSAVENFQKGNYGTAALQGLGAMGDLAMAVPVAGAAIGSVMKAPRAAQRILSSSTTAKDDLAKVPKTPKALAPANEIGFYSPTEAAALNLQRKSGAGQAFLNDIMKGENVKSDEIKAMGLDTFLRGKPNVTADEVRDYIAQNKIQLGEAQYGTSNKRLTKNEWARQTYPDLYARMQKAVEENDQEAVAFYYQTLTREWNAGMGSLIEKPTKFQGYALPGGENYREIVLTLPDPKDALMSQVKALGITRDKDKITVNDILQRGGSIELAENWLKTSQGVYQTPHWDEPNALSHLRVSDRVTDGKKTLLVDEVQSDWHQAGRESGYKQGDMKNKLAALTDEQQKVFNEYINTLDEKDASQLMTRLREIDSEYATLQKVYAEGVPDAPYKDDWYQLTLRRGIKEAVDGGYDRIALPTGARVAERFDLSKQADGVFWSPDKKELTVKTKSGDYAPVASGISDQEISKYVGKDVAKRLLSTEQENIYGVGKVHSLLGEELTVGGEGMKKYYDEIYPGYLEKFGKKYGAESGKTTVDVKGKPEPLFYMDITPKMREEFTSGIPMREGGEVRKFI